MALYPATIVARTDENDTKEHTAEMLYGDVYDNDLYRAVVDGKSNEYCNDLLDAALARCGSPYYFDGRKRWGPRALAFLALFKKPEPEQVNTLDRL